jgi:hypothetical protein
MEEDKQNVPKKSNKRKITKVRETNSNKRVLFLAKTGERIKSFLNEKDLSFRKKKFISLFLLGNGMTNIQTICDEVVIDRQMYHYWKNNDPIFADAMQEGKERYFDYLQEAALEMALDGSDTMVKFLMITEAANTIDRKYFNPALQQTENKVEIQVTHHYAPQSNKIGQEFNIFSEE